MRARFPAVLALVVGAVGMAAPGWAQEDPDAAPPEAGCPHAVVFTLPGITWDDVERWRPREVMDVVANGAMGSMSVRTINSRTTLASAFATIGAGTRLEGGTVAGGPAVTTPAAPTLAAGVDEITRIADEAGYGSARPGALGGALDTVPFFAIGNGDTGLPPPSPAGYGRWTLLAAMDPRGVVERDMTETDLLRPDASAPFGVGMDQGAISGAVSDALEQDCSVAVIDHGDLARVDQLETTQGRALAAAKEAALLAADDLLGDVRSALDPSRDLLMVLSPTSPSVDTATHFGIAVAEGPGFEAGRALESSSTRRPGIVTLPDVAPTILDHLEIDPAPGMLGRAWYSVPFDSDRLDAALTIDDESVFVDGVRTPVSTGFVVVQVIAYAVAFWLLARRRASGDRIARGLQAVALGLVALPVSTYLLGAVDQHSLGTLGFLAVLGATDVVFVVGAWLLARAPLDRLLVLTGFTVAIIFADLVTGSRLQLNTVFSYSPIVAGRFAGIGNIGFSVLTAASLITGTLIVHRYRGDRRALIAVALLFVATVVVDGAPQFGSDVGGIIALVPGLGIGWMLLAGRKPSVRAVVVAALAGIAFLGLFLAIDLARPPESRTHLAGLYENVRDGGAEVLVDALDRKVTANLRVFRSTIWTYLVPPLLGIMAWLLFRPHGRWRRMARVAPRLRAGLIAGLVLSVLGFLVNDSGIVIPAVILSFLAPMTLLIHLWLEETRLEGDLRTEGLP